MAMLWLLALPFVVGCAGSGGGTEPEVSASAVGSGVRGVAVVDAGCPVLEHASTCPQMPLRARIVALRAGTTERVVTVETDPDGAFRFSLAPGAYQIQGENLTGAALPTAMPVPATVRANEYTHVTVVFDSGVRGPR